MDQGGNTVVKTPLHGGDAIIRAILQEQWHLAVTQIHFIPMGDSAYSYRVETQPGNSYYLLATLFGRGSCSRSRQNTGPDSPGR